MQTIPGVELEDLNDKIDISKNLSESIRIVLTKIYGENLWGFFFNPIEIESAKNLVQKFFDNYLSKCDPEDFNTQAVIVKVKNLVDTGSFGLTIELFDEAANFHKQRCDQACEKITPDYIYYRVFCNIALSLKAKS